MHPVVGCSSPESQHLPELELGAQLGPAGEVQKAAHDAQAERRAGLQLKDCFRGSSST